MIKILMIDEQVINKVNLETVVRRCSVKKLFLKISRNLQEKICVGVFLIKLQALLKRDSGIGVSCKFGKVFLEHLR